MDYGHDIGLHFDPSLIVDTMNLEESLSWEKSILEKQFSVKISAFSFHNPTEEHLKIVTHAISGMINTYSKFFKDDVDYCSDSNGYWRYQSIYDCLKNSRKKIKITV